jgi:tRNA(Arg) A34 adenosine deaminase TadA
MPGQPNPEFLRRAIALATRNVLSAAGGPFGAVVVHEGKIVGEGANCVTSTNDPTAHAEVSAIRAAARALNSFTLTGCELYTSCEPCPMCLAAAYWARLDAVYFGASAADAARAGFDDAFLYDELRKNTSERKLSSAQLLADEAWASFAAWISSPSKIEY